MTGHTETIYMLKVGRMYIEKIKKYSSSVRITSKEDEAVKYGLYDEDDGAELIKLMERIDEDVAKVKEMLGVDKVVIVKKTVTTSYEELIGR